jgi:hypothetical protein
MWWDVVGTFGWMDAAGLAGGCDYMQWDGVGWVVVLPLLGEVQPRWVVLVLVLVLAELVCL